jgi:G6PDH family F420-dependent oxidoreductase
MQVTCPIKRYHPAIVAQAAATASAMAPDRFTLGVGTGEALNENVVGGPWPAPSIRLEMLEEAIEVMRELWSGGPVTRYGRFFTVDQATLYTLPERPPDVAVAVSEEGSIGVAARNGHVIITSPDADTIAAYRDAGGDGETYGQATVCYAADRAAGERIMVERWRQTAFGWGVNAELATPGSFVEATDPLTPDAILGDEPVGPDPDDHLASVARYRDAGFDAITVHNVGPEQEDFLRALGRRFGQDVSITRA